MSMPSFSGSFLHSEGWERFQNSLGRETIRLKGSEDTLGYTPLIVSLPLPMGFGSKVLCFRAGDTQDIALSNKMRVLVQETWPSALYLHHEPLTGETGGEGVSTLQPQQTWVTDITGPLEDRLAAMHPKTRYNIRVGERSGVSIALEQTFSKEVWGLFLETGQRGEFGLHPKGYYEKLLALKPSDMRVFLAAARVDGRIAAANLMIDHGSMRTYLHGASSHALRSHMAPYALHAFLLEDAHQKGLAMYDWWGVAPEDATSSHPWSGITRFKTGFGGERVVFPRAQVTPLRSTMYRMYRALQAVRAQCV